MARTNPKGRQKEVFRAEVSDVRQIATILKTVNIAAETKVTVGIAKDGLTFTTLVGSTISVRALLDGATNFTKYDFHPPARGERASTRKQKQKQRRGASSRRTERDSSATQGSDDERDTTRDGHEDDDDEDEQDGGPDGDDDNEGEEEDIKVEFEISLTSLLNCINIFGESTVKPTSAKQAAAREKWKAKQNGYGTRREGTHADADEEEDELAGGADDNDNERWGGQQGRGGSTVNLGKKKGVTTMQMSYKADGSPLVLLLEENGIVTRCDITTFHSVEVSDLPYDDEARVQKLILNSSWLADALSEIDPSCKSLTLRFAPPPRNSDRRIAQQSKGKNRANRQGSDDDDEDDDDNDGGGGRGGQRTQAAFSLEGTGNHGSVQMDYPYTKEVIETCECKEAIRNSYRFSHLMYIRQALAHSTKTSVRTDENGILSMQFMIASAQAASEGSAFVEFTCMPQNDEDEEDDGV